MYARYSSDLQRQTSIDDQLAVARRYADQQGWTVLDAHTYTDEAVSGSSLHGRPGVQALLAVAETTPRPFDVLLVDDSSRVARDLRDALHVVRVLKFAGIRTIYLSQQIDSDNEQAETLLTVHGLVDGLYLQEMSKKIKRGIRGQLERGFHTGARIYGYRSVKVYDPRGRQDADGPVVMGRRLEVDPDQAAVIRQIFRWYVDGVSHPNMVDRLNASDTSSPRGAGWTKHHTERILQNERYRGLQIWGQTASERRPGTNQRVLRKRPRNEWQIAERPDLRIVDDTLFHRATARRHAITGSLKHAPGSGLARGRSGLYSKYLLVGLSRCGTCGRAFTIAAGGHGSPRYGCPHSWRNGRDACGNRLTVRAKVVDPIMLQGLRDQLLQPAMLQRITDAVSAEVSRALSARPSERTALRTRRAAVATKLARLVTALEDGSAGPTLTAQLATREAELRQLDDESATAPRGGGLMKAPRRGLSL